MPYHWNAFSLACRLTGTLDRALLTDTLDHKASGLLRQRTPGTKLVGEAMV